MSKKAGKYPFTRGIYENMYKDRLWTMRQYAGFTSAAESNKRYRYLIDQGVSGLSIAFDLPTQIGFDSDHEMAIGEVGKVGVPIVSIHDMERLFRKIDLNKISTSMTINSTAAILLSFYIVLAEKNGISIDKLNG
ncbi:MAG: methylmalonyl-CoA mutase family protein, partial [Candidatus Marinimicrobia bacterium]|nr:methylmalonyl-CoA mutase family protein [Candidatus Neomarinimicrobiota bacterium]